MAGPGPRLVAARFPSHALCCAVWTPSQAAPRSVCACVLSVCARCACVCVCVIYKCVPAARPAVASLQPPAPPSHRYNQPTRHRPARRWPGLPSSRRRPSRSPACRSGTPTGSARRAPGATPSRPSPRTRTCANAAAPRCTRRRRGVRGGDAVYAAATPPDAAACVRAWSHAAFPVARTPERKPAARPPARPRRLPLQPHTGRAGRPPGGVGVLQRARVAARSCRSVLVLERSLVAILSRCNAPVLHFSCVATCVVLQRGCDAQRAGVCAEHERAVRQEQRAQQRARERQPIRVPAVRRAGVPFLRLFVPLAQLTRTLTAVIRTFSVEICTLAAVIRTPCCCCPYPYRGYWYLYYDYPYP
jgi:hypothetical protein